MVRGVNNNAARSLTPRASSTLSQLGHTVLGVVEEQQAVDERPSKVLVWLHSKVFSSQVFSGLGVFSDGFDGL